ncbi:glycosyltransferase [Kocuria rosea]|uniref:glycosyltransferase n=1 Tax=Kocuria rosea TaxID=1275 RepID=UPI001364A83D|nr:glycosyltransferase [Kocuria polaris]
MRGNALGDMSAAGDGTHRAILVANTGGHLAQLVQLREKLDLQGEPLWITFDHPQSRSLLAYAENVVYMPYVASRDWRAAIKVLPRALRVMSRAEYDIVVSTGAALAVPVFIAAIFKGIRPVYIESVSRFEGPSLTGRLVSWLPGVQLFCQQPTWAGGRWTLGPSVLDDFSTHQESVPEQKALRIFVTLGTIQPYRFDRLVDMVLEHFGTDHDFVWQLGVTGRSDLPGKVHETLPVEDMDRNIVNADVIVSHAGVGMALSILRLGKMPILVPRLAAQHEHVDDHQLQIAKELERRGLAVPVTPRRPLTTAAVEFVRSITVTSTGAPVL